MNNKLIFIALAASLSAGCSTMKVPAKVTHPAEVNMTNHKKIAIMDIEGNYGNQFHDTIKARLASSGQFDVQNCMSKVRWVETTEEVEVTNKKSKHQANVDNAVAVINLFSTGKLNIPSATETKKQTITKKTAVKELPETCKEENLIVTAIVKGNYNGTYRTNLETTNSTCKGKDKKEYPCKHYTRRASVTIEGSIDVINRNSGQIIATKQLNDRCQDSASSTGNKPRHIDERRLKNTCISRNATEFARTLIPWTETVMVAYQKDGDLPQLERGIKLVELGRNEQAIEIFSAAIKEGKRNMLKSKVIAKAYWNLGLAYEYTWQFQKALDAFDEGYMLDSDQKFMREKRNTERLRAKREKLLQQQKTSFVSNE